MSRARYADGAVDTVPRLPPRARDGHKGTFGTTLVVGGFGVRPDADTPDRPRMFGGAALAALAALRGGCGLARLMTPAPLLDAALSVAPVCTGIPMDTDERGAVIPSNAVEALSRQLDSRTGGVDALVIGPALGEGEGVTALVLHALSRGDVPTVLDADALNAISSSPEAARAACLARDGGVRPVLTPHPGEFARLAGALIVRASDGAPAGLGSAAELARVLGAIVVLKGARTMVSDGSDHWVHDRPNPALATGGSGDVLAGLIGGLAAQHVRAGGSGAVSAFDAACAGVACHAMAAERWCASAGATGGMLATDLLDEIPAAVESLRR